MFNMLIPKVTFDSLVSLSILPENWYNHKREQTDINTRRNAVKNGLEKYVIWEQDTKKFLENMSLQAVNIGAIGLAQKIKTYLKDKEKEIKLGQKEWLEIKTTDYDLPTIISKQGYLCKKYKKKIEKMRKELNDD